VKVGGTNFVGALDLNDLDKEGLSRKDGYTPTPGSIGKKAGRPAIDNSKMVMVM